MNKTNKTARQLTDEALELEAKAKVARETAALLIADERRLAREAANRKARADEAELKARDLGHSAGLSEVENYYSDLAELLS